jgi:dipeptidyl aminopeptidase/acylaminoacyl peptidase
MHWPIRNLALIALVLTGCGSPSNAESLSIPHPDRTGAIVEYFEAHPAGAGPWPTVVFLHGHQGPTKRTGGQVFADWGVLSDFAKKGYLAVSVSLPGYGGSTGPEDFAGAFTQHAVQAVIAKLEADNQAVPDKVLIQGVSLGAVTGALVAAHDRDIAGLVLISGLYDLPAFFAHPKSAAALAAMTVAIAQTGGSLEALQSRSALPLAPNIHASTLILNGAKDDRADAGQARDFAAAIKASGGQAEAHIYSDFGHEIPVKARDAEISAFIDATLRR